MYEAKKKVLPPHGVWVIGG